MLNELINIQNAIGRRSEALPPERLHFQAYSAKRCGHEISLVPSKRLDTLLAPSEFVNTVSRRFAIDVVDSCRPWDAQGSYCLSCVAGGRHDAAQRGSRRPLLFLRACWAETNQRSTKHSTVYFSHDGQCRPADILCIPTVALSNKCWAAGYRFWPIVHEIQCGMAIRAISEDVGKRENRDAVRDAIDVTNPSSCFVCVVFFLVTVVSF